MASILRRITTAKGVTVTLSTDDDEPEHAAAQLIEPDAAERDAIAAARVAFDAGHLEEVRRLLTPFADAATWPVTLTTLARASLVEGDFDAADGWLRRAEAKFPQDPKVWKALAVLRRMQNRPLEELQYRRSLVLLVPKPAPGAHLAYMQAFAKAYAEVDDPPLAELGFIADKLLAKPIESESDREERLLVAQSLYEIKPLTQQAFRQYKTASPCPEGQRDVSVAWLPMHQWCDRIAVECRRSLDHGTPGRRPMLAELTRVAVLPTMQWAPVLDETGVALDGFLMHKIKLRTEEPGSPILMNRAGRRAELRLPRDLPLIERPALLLGGMAQYYHNTVDFLSSLAVAELLDAPRDLAIVVNDDLAPFQEEQLQLLGIEPDRLLRVKADSPVRFAQLWIPSRLVVTGVWMDPLLPQWYRRKLAPQGAQAGRKLYVSRSGTQRRRVSNEEAVIQLVRQHGYEIVRPEQLGVAQQIELFAQASHIVGPTGAAMTNMIYAAPGAKVAVFYNRYMVSSQAALYFDALAEASGHGFRQVLCKPAGSQDIDRPVDADITVDLDLLRVAIE